MSTNDSGIYKSGSINTNSSDYNQKSDQVGTRIKDALEHGIDKSIIEIEMNKAEDLINPNSKVGKGCYGSCYKAKYTIKVLDSKFGLSTFEKSAPTIYT